MHMDTYDAMKPASASPSNAYISTKTKTVCSIPPYRCIDNHHTIAQQLLLLFSGYWWIATSVCVKQVLQAHQLGL